MSSRQVSVLIAFMAFASLFIGPAAAQNNSIADLLLRDEILQAEAQIGNQPKTALNMAFRGEIEFRKGNFAQADTLYREALKMDSRNARAHFGMGKLALAKVKARQAIQEFTRAIELDPNESLYRLYIGEAWGTDKNFVQQRKQLEEYLRLNPNDEDRVTEAGGSRDAGAFGSGRCGRSGPQNPAPSDQNILNLIFTSIRPTAKVHTSSRSIPARHKRSSVQAATEI
jgi:tetratricopeptide (TPR) repeat protein